MAVAKVGISDGNSGRRGASGRSQPRGILLLRRNDNIPVYVKIMMVLRGVVHHNYTIQVWGSMEWNAWTGLNRWLSLKIYQRSLESITGLDSKQQASHNQHIVLFKHCRSICS